MVRRCLLACRLLPLPCLTNNTTANARKQHFKTRRVYLQCHIWITWECVCLCVTCACESVTYARVSITCMCVCHMDLCLCVCVTCMCMCITCACVCLSHVHMCLSHVCVSHVSLCMCVSVTYMCMCITCACVSVCVYMFVCVRVTCGCVYVSVCCTGNSHFPKKTSWANKYFFPGLRRRIPSTASAKSCLFQHPPTSTCVQPQRNQNFECPSRSLHLVLLPKH